MSRFRYGGYDDDIFSPIQNDTSAVNESIDNSEGSSSNYFSVTTDEFLLTDAVKTEVIVKVNVLEPTHDDAFESKDKDIMDLESVDMFTPISNRNSSHKANAKKHSSELKELENLDYMNSAFLEDDDNNSRQKLKAFKYKNVSDSNILKSDTSDLPQKKSKSTCSSSKDESAKQGSLKDLKKRHKDNKPILKKSDSLTDLEKEINMKLNESSSMSVEFKKCTSTSSEREIPNSECQADELTVNSLIFNEASDEKKIRHFISNEAHKLRMLMYSQQMAFYKEMNILKDEMDRRYLETRERLLTVIATLSEMKTALEIKLSNKN